MSNANITASALRAPADTIPGQDVTRLRDLSPQQWRSGIAAWLGWMFDGLDMHLYTLVATVFVAQLLGTYDKDPVARHTGAWIQAAFLFGWALGGGFFGRIGDRLGRSRALMLTILTYALFTGLSFFAQTWWELFICRFLAALGIGGEWSVGASLLSETWPRRWRPWLAAVLQSGVNIGILFACLGFSLLRLFDLPHRCVFLIGIVPAFLVFWIRRAVPEPEEWHQARKQSGPKTPSVLELFRGPVRRTTILTLLVCTLTLTPHWAFNYWWLQDLRNLLPDPDWTEGMRDQVAAWAFFMLMVAAIIGNFLGGWIAVRIGYPRAIAILCLGYFATMTFTYCVPRGYTTILMLLPLMGIFQGIFALFTMYMPPLFPTLLRTTGAGFCYNIGRIAAALGTVFFGVFAQVNDYSLTLFYAGWLFLPAGLIAFVLPEPPNEATALEPVE